MEIYYKINDKNLNYLIYKYIIQDYLRRVTLRCMN